MVRRARERLKYERRSKIKIVGENEIDTWFVRVGTQENKRNL